MVVIRNTQRAIKVDTVQMKKDVQKILDILDYADFDVGILIVNNATMQDYNREYRGKDKPTDVLSFPTFPDLKAGERIVAHDADEKNLGDLILAPAYIVADAKRLKTTFEKRMERLLVHGICHLLGYDHIEDADYKIMYKKEMSLLRALRKKA
jgi:probable rRNA maturation factor